MYILEAGHPLSGCLAWLVSDEVSVLFLCPSMVSPLCLNMVHRKGMGKESFSFHRLQYCYMLLHPYDPINPNYLQKVSSLATWSHLKSKLQHECEGREFNPYKSLFLICYLMESIQNNTERFKFKTLGWLSVSCFHLYHSDL